jgi:hypothetical protein
LEHVWQNNIAAMARDLRVSHAALSRVLAGQTPSGKMLAALAERSDVNVHWMLTGTEQPSLGRRGSVGSIFWPVATQLLPGEPRDHPGLVGQVTLPAASPFLLESAYWFQLGADAPIVAAPGSGMATGDYLLIETSSRWTRRPEAYLGRLLATRLPGDAGVALAQSRRFPEPFEVVEQHDLNTFGRVREARLFPLLTREGTQRKETPSSAGSRGMVRLYGDDVVGVVLQRVTFLTAMD